MSLLPDKILRSLAFALLVLPVFGHTAPAAIPPAEPRTHVVVIENMEFSPRVLTVRLGDTVEFRNIDVSPHTVTEQGPGKIDSGMIEEQKQWKLVADRAGTLRYACTYHPVMTGTLIVEAK
ncbi:MAG: cupredoxin domain-containing protein [Opitutae bacterium]|nr:cupredoxin domain-containing protein [Opitutae bacterium]